MITTTHLIFLAAILSLSFLLAGLRRHHSPVQVNPQDLYSNTQPVDLPAFRNLVDPAEEEYLRARLNPADFRAIHRERVWAALEYVQRASHNAALLVRAGQAAQRDPDPSVAAAAMELVNNAIELRLHAFIVQVALYLRLVVPGSQIYGQALATRYQVARENLGRLVRLQEPAGFERKLSYF